MVEHNCLLFHRIRLADWQGLEAGEVVGCRGGFWCHEYGAVWRRGAPNKLGHRLCAHRHERIWSMSLQQASHRQLLGFLSSTPFRPSVLKPNL